MCPWYTVGGKIRDKNLDQKINIKFCVTIGKSGSLVYGEYAMNKLSALEWHKQFKEGRKDVEDNPRSGLLKLQRADANVDRVQTLMSSD
jgi:hypothetical protein